MKKMILGVLIAMACFQTADAQKAKTYDSKKVTPEMMVQRMDKALLLNDEQEKDMLNLYTEMFKNRKDMKSATKEERIAKRKEFHKKMAEILTEEQMTKWQKIQKEQVQKMKKSRKNHKKK